MSCVNRVQLKLNLKNPFETNPIRICNKHSLESKWSGPTKIIAGNPQHCPKPTYFNPLSDPNTKKYAILIQARAEVNQALIRHTQKKNIASNLSDPKCMCDADKCACCTTLSWIFFFLRIQKYQYLEKYCTFDIDAVDFCCAIKRSNFNLKLNIF